MTNPSPLITRKTKDEQGKQNSDIKTRQKFNNEEINS